MSGVIVSPDEPNPTHHISLSDGVTEIGLIAVKSDGSANALNIARGTPQRTALKTTSGDTTYSDFQAPWASIAQSSFIGGRASKDFDTSGSSNTRYADGYRVNSLFGRLVNGPQDVLTKGYRKQDFNLPGSVEFITLQDGDMKFLAVQFTASASYNAETLSLLIRRRGTPRAPLSFEICNDNAGDPGTVIFDGEYTVDMIKDTVSVLRDVELIGVNLVYGTKYWVKVSSTDATTRDYWQIGTERKLTDTKQSVDNTTWSLSSHNLYFRLRDTDTETSKHLFQYKYSQFLIINATDNTAPKLYINGDRGVADPNTTDLATLIDATKAWAINEFVGAIVLITGGTGMNEAQPWRTIMGNNATTLTVDMPWVITHDTTTEYAIIGSDIWNEITGHGIASSVTDVLPTADNLYFALGDGANIRRGNWYNNAGAATWRWADDGTNKAAFLKSVWSGAQGLSIWKANNKDANSKVSVSKAPIVTTWGDMTFANTVTFSDQLGQITGLEEYGDPNTLFVLRAGALFYIAEITGNPPSYTAVEIPLREMHTVMEDNNGRAHTVNGVYLYFSLGFGGIERYLGSQLDDVGPNNDEGLPPERSGTVSKLLSHPGRYFAAIDAGADGYSSVLAWNGAGYHEIYRAPQPGMRIKELGFQVINGISPDRLWVSVGGDIIWLHFPSGIVSTMRDKAMRFVHEAVFESSWITAGLVDVFKYYKSIKLFTENLKKDSITVEADYKIDNEEGWTAITDNEVFDISPVEEVNIVPSQKRPVTLSLQSAIGVNAKRFKYRLRMMTDDNRQTPDISTIVVETIYRITVKYSYVFSARFDDQNNLRGEPEVMDYEERITTLDRWAEQAVPLIMRGKKKMFDDKAVFLEPIALSPSYDVGEGYIGQISIKMV